MYTNAEDHSRGQFWRALIPGYGDMHPGARSRAKVAYAKVFDYTIPGDLYSDYQQGTSIEEIKKYHDEIEKENEMKYPASKLSVDCSTDKICVNAFAKACKALAQASVPAGYCTYSLSTDSYTDVWVGSRPQAMKQEKEIDMYTETQTQRQHLNSRLSFLYSNKERDMEKHFGLRGERPETFKQAVEWLKAGKFEVDGEDSEDYPYFDSYNLAEMIIWKDPSLKKDKEGFKAAKKVMDDAFQAAKDEIAIYAPEKGLETVRAFEARTFH